MLAGLKQLLSATEFDRAEVTGYAQQLILPETRSGFVWMAVLLSALQAGIWFLQFQVGRGDDYFNTFCLLSLLSVHMLWSIRYVKDTKTLHLLAITYLTMYATAIVLVAHRTGYFDVGLMASAVMLLVAVPLIPWGLREAITVNVLIYSLFTSSTLVVAGRFTSQTLWTLQFLFFASALIAFVLVARNVKVRKNDIETRFDLDQAQQKHEQISLTDPLTGARNRRYLDKHFSEFVNSAIDEKVSISFVLLDVDYFKMLNDSFGHQSGDIILQRLVTILEDRLPKDSIVVRLGGDEFAILLKGSACHDQIERCLTELQQDSAVLTVTGGKLVSVTAGFAVNDFDAAIPSLEQLYRIADEELYTHKRGRDTNEVATNSFRTHKGKVLHE